MKKLTIYTAIITLALVGAGCRKKFFYDGINDDPNRVKSPDPVVLLPAAETYIAFAQGGDLSRYDGIFSQQYRGVSRQFSAYDNYTFSPNDFSILWANFYSGALIDLKKTTEISQSNGNNHYVGIAKTLTAYSLMMLTDHFGDIPYSDALLGESNNLQPKYDTQEKIYSTIDQLLNEASASFGSSFGTLKPGNDDLIFGGNIPNWIAFTNSLKIRSNLHQLKRKPSLLNPTLALLPSAITATANDADFAFLDAAAQASPWFQYQSQRGDIGFITGKAFDIMTAKADPRLTKCIDTANDKIGLYFGSRNSKVNFMSFAELKFVEAELRFATDPTASKTAMIAGITANMKKMGINDSIITAYVIAQTSGAATLKQILEEKYIALYTHPESFADLRRTGFPVLTPNNGSNLPKRYLYPNTENNYNAANVPSATLYSKLWWDI